MTESKNIYKQIFDLSQEAYMLVDFDGFIQLTNRKAQELYGYSEKELAKFNVKDLIHPDYINEFKNFIGKVTSEGSFQGETIDFRKDGSQFQCGIYGKLVKLNGQTLLMATLQDITENKKTLEKLKSSEEKYKLLAENIQDVIWILTPDLKISYVSPSIKKMRGYSVEEVLAQTFEEIALPHSLILIKELMSAFFLSLKQGKPDKESKKAEIEQQCKDGSTIWSEILVTPFFDEKDNFQFFLGVSRDVTDRKNAQEEKNQLQNQLELQLERMPIGFIVWDKTNQVVSWNPAAEKIFGYSEQEVKGTQPFDKIVPPEFQSNVYQIWERFQESNDTIHNINQNLTKTRGLITCKWSNTPLKSAEGKIIGALSMIQDITKDEKNEQELKLHKENLEDIVKKRTEEIEKQAKKLHDSQIALTFLLEDVNETRLDLEAANSKLDAVNKELEAFSYSISHDLRAPLNRMDGFSKALLDDFSDNLGERGIHYLSRIRASSQHMATLINNILTLSRISRRDILRKEINISEIISNILDELIESSPKRKVNFKVQEGILVKADKTLVEIILRNLLENAWKFSQTKDITEIVCGTKEVDGQKFIYIEDNGVGFNMKYYDQLFQPFRRLHPERDFEGTGIGLATVLRIVNRHKGKIWAESMVGKGTTFNFIL